MIFTTVVGEKEARILANKLVEKVKDVADKVKGAVNEAVKEGERMGTPTSY
jgi:hypothetical protein